MRDIRCRPRKTCRNREQGKTCSVRASSITTAHSYYTVRMSWTHTHKSSASIPTYSITCIDVHHSHTNTLPHTHRDTHTQTHQQSTQTHTHIHTKSIILLSFTVLQHMFVFIQIESLMQRFPDFSWQDPLWQWQNNCLAYYLVFT